MHATRLGIVVAAGLGVALLAAGVVTGGARAWIGYLAGAVALVAIPLGSLALLAANRLIGGGWTGPVAPVLLAAARTLPLALLLFLPIPFALGEIYPWTGRADPAPVWLSEGFFIGRTVGYFAIWLASLALLVRGGGQRVAVGVALALYTVSGSLAGVDWLMTLDPLFNSSMFGLLFVAGHLVAALAFAALVTYAREPERPVGMVGGLLLAGVMTVAYLDYMQFLVVWAADHPAEAQWYVRRGAGALAVGFTLLVIAAKALVPTVALAWPAVRLRQRPLAIAAGIVLAGHLLNTAWLALPEADGVVPAALAFAGVVSLGAAAAIARLAAQSPAA
ncbi:MAG: hypothetical protein H3C38_11875 [Rhodospirillales bacterium]|nr:hypothetical protein [Rhodospirillales bacterium]